MADENEEPNEIKKESKKHQEVNKNIAAQRTF